MGLQGPGPGPEGVGADVRGRLAQTTHSSPPAGDFRGPLRCLDRPYRCTSLACWTPYYPPGVPTRYTHPVYPPGTTHLLTPLPTTASTVLRHTFLGPRRRT